MSNTTELVELVQGLLTENERALSAVMSVLTSTPFVITTGDGVFMAIKERDGNVVMSLECVGLSRATRFSREDADNLCRDGNIRDGLGTTARPIAYIHALEAQGKLLREFLADIANPDKSEPTKGGDT